MKNEELMLKMDSLERDLEKFYGMEEQLAVKYNSILEQLDDKNISKDLAGNLEQQLEDVEEKLKEIREEIDDLQDELYWLEVKDENNYEG